MTDGRTQLVADSTRPRVAVVAEVRLYREGLVRALETSPSVEVVGSASVGPLSLTLAASTLPDVVLMDASAAIAPANVRAIATASPDTRVIAFAIADEEHDAI